MKILLFALALFLTGCGDTINQSASGSGQNHADGSASNNTTDNHAIPDSLAGASTTGADGRCSEASHEAGIC